MQKAHWLFLIALFLSGALLAQQTPAPDTPAPQPTSRKEKCAQRKAARHDKRRQRGEATTRYSIHATSFNLAQAQDLRAENATMVGPGVQTHRGLEQVRAASLQTLTVGAGYNLLIPTHIKSQTHSISFSGEYSYQRPLGAFRGLKAYGGGALSVQNYTRISPSLQNSAIANDFYTSLGVRGTLAGPLDLWLFKPLTDISLSLPVFSWAMRSPVYSFAYLDAVEHRFGPLGVISPIHFEAGMRLPLSRWHRSTNRNLQRFAYVWDMYHIADPLTPVVFATHSLSYSIFINREYHETH